MGQLNAANTSYPNILDTATALMDGVGIDQIVAQHQNGPASAILALETTLGVVPQGSAADVGTRLNVAHNLAGAVTLGTAASTVGLLALTRGGVGQTIASTTNTTDGFLLGFANGVLQPLTVTSGTGISAVSTSGTWTISQSPSGTLVAGTSLTMNPIVFSSAVTQAHALATTPTFVDAKLQCLTAERGWLVGDVIKCGTVITDSASSMGLIISADVTTTRLTMGNSLAMLDKGTFASAAFTAANWKIIVTPYKVT